MKSLLEVNWVKELRVTKWLWCLSPGVFTKICSVFMFLFFKYTLYIRHFLKLVDNKNLCWWSLTLRSEGEWNAASKFTQVYLGRFIKLIDGRGIYSSSDMVWRTLSLTCTDIFGIRTYKNLSVHILYNNKTYLICEFFAFNIN